MKKNKNKDVATVEKEVSTEVTTTTNVTEATATESTVAPVKLGRPVVPNSARQKRLAEIEKRKAEQGGYIKLGRPSVPGSKRQEKLKEAAARKADPNYVPAKGRPKMTDEQKAEAAARRKEAYEVWLKNQETIKAAKGE